MRTLRAILFPLLSVLSACTLVPVIVEHPVPPPDKLKPQDCAIYGREIAVRSKIKPSESEVKDLESECKEQLAGKVRRVIVRCWLDAQNVAEVKSCNLRF